MQNYVNYLPKRSKIKQVNGFVLHIKRAEWHSQNLGYKANLIKSAESYAVGPPFLAPVSIRRGMLYPSNPSNIFTLSELARGFRERSIFFSMIMKMLFIYCFSFSLFFILLLFHCHLPIIILGLCIID